MQTTSINMSNFSELLADSTTSHSGDDEIKLNDYYFTLAESIYFYGLSIILPFGLTGNCISLVVVLLSPIIRRTTTGQYLIALALADCTVVIGDGIRWLASHRHSIPEYYFPQYLGLNFYDTSSAACMTTNFLRYAGRLWSVWITVAIAVERLIAVAFPHKVSHISTIMRTRISIVFIVAVSVGLGSFPFWTLNTADNLTFGVYMPKCVIYSQDAYTAWNNAVNKLGILVIPGVLITILTVAIIFLLYRNWNHGNYQSRKQRETNVSRLELSMQTQMTIMLVAVCVSTIALRTPYTIAYYFRARFWNSDFVDPVTDVQTYMAYKITDMINTINFAINFVLYCVWSSSFRREAKRIFCRGTEAPSNISRFDTEEICLNDMKHASSAGNDS